MSDKLDFSLPQKKYKTPVILIVILVLLGLSLAINAILLFFNLGSSGQPAVAVTSKALPATKQKELALKLQKSSLPRPAAQAWQDYLALANIDAQERAAIWYTIGKIYQEADLYEEALESYYRSEALSIRDDIEDELGRRVQDCLEYLGKFAALRSELSERVGLAESNTESEVLAEIGTEKITKADLDAKIEQYIDFQLSQYAAYLDPEALAKQKEDLFKHYASAEGQQEMLNRYIVEEVLYRKAREEQLAEDPVTRAMLRETERQVLAQQLVSKTKGSKINITENDLKAYYEAQKGDYIEDGVQKSFAEVRDEIYNKLIAQKEREVEQQLVDELRKEYNVVIHSEQPAKEDAQENEK